MHPKELRYSPEHVWVKPEGEHVRLGLTDFYQGQLHSIVYVELPPPGRELQRGAPFGSIESSKTTSDLVSPLSGRVLQTNAALAEKPGLINKEPYGAGWLLLVKPGKPEELKSLLTAEAYLNSAAPQEGGPCQA